MSKMGFPVDFPQIETKRLLLRELVQADAKAVFHNYADEEIANNFMDKPFADIAQAKQLIDAFKAEFTQGKALTWALALKETNACVGTCSYMIESSSCAEIGYDLSKAHWGKGLMSEALRAVIDYGFDRLGFQKIEADTLSYNTRSINLLKRLGFHLDDVRDKSHFFSLQNDVCQ